MDTFGPGDGDEDTDDGSIWYMTLTNVLCILFINYITYLEENHLFPKNFL
jgi:hypothetical protein